MVNNFDQLYYQNPYMSEFVSDLLSYREMKGRTWVRLSQTCFYPLGGGQPGDQGELLVEDPTGSGLIKARFRVVDTILQDGQVWHGLENASLSDLEPLQKCKFNGKIDFDRRFDFMQQHTGEHIVSGLVKQKYGYNNVGFKIGETETSFDFDGDLTWSELNEIELLANQAVYQNLKIQTYQLQGEELRSWQYRSKLDLTGPVRLIVIPGYDQCACAGTHVARTGEIGQIKLIRRESYKSGVRLHLVCGRRALLYQQKLQQILNSAGQIISANLDNFIELSLAREAEIDQLKQAAEARTKAWSNLVKQRLETRQTSLLVSPTIFEKKEWLPVARDLASHLDGFVCFLFARPGDTHFIFLHSEKLDVKEFLPEMREQIGFKGGGNGSTIQGHISVDLSEVEVFLKDVSAKKLGKNSAFILLCQD